MRLSTSPTSAKRGADQLRLFTNQSFERFGVPARMSVEKVDPNRGVDQDSHRRFLRLSMLPSHSTLPRRSSSCRRRFARANRRSASFTTSVLVLPSETFIAASRASSSMLSVVLIVCTWVHMIRPVRMHTLRGLAAMRGSEPDTGAIGLCDYRRVLNANSARQPLLTQTPRSSEPQVRLRTQLFRLIWRVRLTPKRVSARQ